ncbi:cytochrome c-type biogenesis protein CcmH [Granulicella pectinivorans]|jgi:cytochrome c-type biogenesis protein CcmH|uniref:Cytochrome c-type biogenesis protein n=1 Tax=Granulicella pectinivorans TaxID=474950 RepID=A0A1I6MN32_9BACT|nr:cytochrome c-type biogenesis protein CcmH [Granulicella pectinivorans]SFS17082.1 cytochrome c-type biogenesis protein CcmH [Granulicella pectinivorans]
MRKYLSLVAGLLLCVGLMGAADPAQIYNKVGHEMMCVCGCNQILLECNHVGCPDSTRMIGELHDQVNLGGPENLILNWFAAKYGAIVLAAPMRGGFDDVAWITPMAVFLFATVGVAFLIKIWRKRRPPTDGPGSGAPPISDALRAQIRQETQY